MLGDVSRSASCDYLAEKLWAYRKENEIDFAVVNGENSAEGNGIDKTSAQTLLSAGADVITTGNHAFRRYDAKDLFEKNKNVLRPANFPGNVPGEGAVLTDAAGISILVVNMLGIVMMEPLENPFVCADRVHSRFPCGSDLRKTGALPLS